MNSSNSTSSISPLHESFREYAWNYFELHAEQRLKTFQFFITLATSIVGGSLLLIRFGQAHKWMSILGFFLVFLTFTFWKLDLRNRSLVKNAEEALKFLDNQHALPDIDGAPHTLRIFSRDDYLLSRSIRPILGKNGLSYTRCFGLVFIAFALLGFTEGLACLIFLPM